MQLIRLEIQGISYSHTQNGAYALILKDAESDKRLPIVIGAFEAQAIATAVDKELAPARPLTHDLFKTFLDEFSVQIKQIIIHKLVDGVFYSSIVCNNDQGEKILDARTSDAIALAVRMNAPIFTFKNILDKAGIVLDEHDGAPNFENDEIDDEEDDDSEEIENIFGQFESSSVSSIEDLKDKLAQISHQSSEQPIDENPYKNTPIAELESLLDDALQNEHYDKAAKIRDEIARRK